MIQERRSSEEIRRDIEGTREQMHETVDELEHRLSPRRAARSAVRDHPIPLTLIGLGLVWLTVEKKTDKKTDALQSSRVHRSGGGRGSSVKGELKEKGSDVKEDVEEKASDMADQASSAAADAGESLRRTGEAARERGREMKRGLWSALEEQPLAMGAAAFGLGLIGGIVLPSSRLEDRKMGAASRALKDELAEEARDVARSGKAVAKEAAETAKEDVESAAADVKSTAEERAREEGLDAEGLKERSADVKDSVKDRAGD